MTTIFCQKLQREAEALTKPPLPGELGQRIMQHISQAAWQLWLNQQTMLINEYRLSMIDPKARSFLMQEMEKFLFSDDTTAPPGFIPPAADDA